MEIKCTPEELKQLIGKEPCGNKAQKEKMIQDLRERKQMIEKIKEYQAAFQP